MMPPGQQAPRGLDGGMAGQLGEQFYVRKGGQSCRLGKSAAGGLTGRWRGTV
jgi:N-methylhydantoinase B/oxoprolinase/acetone carboxylase alpha subunit